MVEGHLEQEQKEKQEQEQKINSHLIKAYKKVCPDLMDIKIGIAKFGTQHRYRNQVIEKIRNIYNSVFKGLTSKKVRVFSKEKTNGRIADYHITPTGFAIKEDNYSINCTSINSYEGISFMKELIELSKILKDNNANNILVDSLKKELSEHKFKLVEKFFIKSNLDELETTIKEQYEMVVGKMIETLIIDNVGFRNYLGDYGTTDGYGKLEDINKILEKTKTIKKEVLSKIALRSDTFIFELGRFRKVCNFSYMPFEELIIIEQIKKELIKILKTGQQDIELETKKLSKFVRYLEDKFQNILGLAELIKSEQNNKE